MVCALSHSAVSSAALDFGGTGGNSTSCDGISCSDSVVVSDVLLGLDLLVVDLVAACQKKLCEGVLTSFSVRLDWWISRVL